MRILTLASSLLFAGSALGSTISRVTTFADGNVLYSYDLNLEFNNLVNGVNSIDNSNITSSAAIAPSKISSAIAGSGLTRDATSGALAVNPDGTTIVIQGNQVEIGTNSVNSSLIALNGVTTQNIAPLSVTQSKLELGGVSTGIQTSNFQIGAVTGSVIADSGIATSKLQDQSVTTAKIADAAVTPAKIAAASYASSGSSCSTTVTGSPTAPVSIFSLTTHGRPVTIYLQPDVSASANTKGVYGTTGGVSGSGYGEIRRAGVAIIRFPIWQGGNLGGGIYTASYSPITYTFTDTAAGTSASVQYDFWVYPSTGAIICNGLLFGGYEVF